MGEYNNLYKAGQIVSTDNGVVGFGASTV